MKNEQSPDSDRTTEDCSPSTFRAAREFRWCNYLHLHTAKRTCDIWKERDGSPHPIFTVRGKRRLVFVRGYFEDKPFYRDDSCQIYQVTTKRTLLNGKIKPNLKGIGQVIRNDSRISFVQTIPERYPSILFDNKRVEDVDELTVASISKILDFITSRRGVQEQQDTCHICAVGNSGTQSTGKLGESR